MKYIDKFAQWFLNRFKPEFMDKCKYIGLLTIYLIIAFLLGKFINLFPYHPESEISAFFLILLFGCGIFDSYMKNIFLKKRIEEIIDEEEDNIEKIIRENEDINSKSFHEVEEKIGNQLQKDIFFNEYIKSEGGEFPKEKARKVGKKINGILTQRYYLIKKNLNN